MSFILRNIIRAGILVSAVFVLAVVVLLVINLGTPPEVRWSFGTILKGAGGISIIGIPGALFLAWRYPSRRVIDAVSVEEILLTENDLAEAVDLWLYAHRGLVVEGDVVFGIEEEGKAYCRVTVRR